MGSSFCSGHSTGASYTDLQLPVLQKGFTAHQVLFFETCIRLKMTSRVAYKGKKTHMSTYLREQLASFCQTDMFEAERKEIPHKKNGLTIMAGLSLQNVIFWLSSIHHAV